MGWRDRGYDDGYSKRRVFSAEAFFSWALPLFTVPRWVPGLAGIRVRVHITYLLIAGSELLNAMGKDYFRFAGPSLATLFVIVLLHEFGHCLACRRVGGSADDVLMWPLGGLASCAPPPRWKAAFVTTAGGPLVNVGLIPVLGGALLAAGGSWRLLVFNPLHPVLQGGSFWDAPWHVWLWSAYLMNLGLLLFNLIVPMYPMDGAKMVRELLWSRIGYKRSLLIAANVGLVTAVVLGVYGLATWNLLLVGVALFGGTTCWGERFRAKAMEEEPEWFYDTDKGFAAFEEPKKRKGPTWAERRAAKAAAKADAKEREAQASLDAILDKIRVKGIASLTARERATLSDATERRRGGGSGSRGA
jgi:Zn-dependent protease